MSREFGPRRAEWIVVDDAGTNVVSDETVAHLEYYDLVYRTLCAILFNFAQSGHHKSAGAGESHPVKACVRNGPRGVLQAAGLESATIDTLSP